LNISLTRAVTTNPNYVAECGFNTRIESVRYMEYNNSDWMV